MDRRVERLITGRLTVTGIGHHEWGVAYTVYDQCVVENVYRKHVSVYSIYIYYSYYVNHNHIKHVENHSLQYTKQKVLIQLIIQVSILVDSYFEHPEFSSTSFQQPLVN